MSDLRGRIAFMKEDEMRPNPPERPRLSDPITRHTEGHTYD